MPTLSKIREAVRTLPVPTPGDGEPLEISYCPARLTRKVQQELEKAQKLATAKLEKDEELTVEESEGSARLVVALLSTWNLTDDKGKTCPITVEFLANEVGYFLINQMLKVIREDMNPGN